MPGVPFYVALGSNLGDSVRHILDAFDRLEALSALPVRRSSLWDTTPVDCPPGSPRFINAVAGLVSRTGDSPESVLAALQALEREFGRRPKQVLNEARPLDLDLLAWGDVVQADPVLTLPHPRAHQRRFVLQPLAEIAPDLVLPGVETPVAGLLARLEGDEVVRRIGGTIPPPHP